MKKNRILFIIGISLVLSLSYLPHTRFTSYMGTQEAMAQHAGHGGTPPPPEQPQKPKEEFEPSKERAKEQVKEQPKEQAKEQPKKGPKEQTAAEEVPAVEIPLEKQQLIGVKTTAVSIKPIRQTTRTVGRIEYDEKKLATINVKFESWIEKLHVDYVGKYVKKGDPLAEIYSPELFATQQEFINLIKWKVQSNDVKDEAINKMLTRDSDAIVEAAKRRLRLWDITDEQIQAIAESGKPMRTLTIYSPVNGTVIQKTAIQGMRVMPGEKLFDIADLSTVWIISDIYEYELPMIRAGDTAKISMSYFPGKEFTAVIDYVYPVLASETRTVKVRFSIPNPGGQLKPGMFTNVELKVNMGKRLVVPQDAVIDTGMRQIVYVDKGEGNFEPRDVVAGIRSDGMVEILKGLKEKERVATAATFLIDSEARLKGIVK
jgi:Cu(I)/Ag(I) efflux system membrane fusion protein